jgi:hypothetical protein
MRRAAVSAILAVQIGSPLGTSAQNSQAWDSRFRAIPDAKTIGEHMRRLTARPHHVGSPYDKDNAEWILGRFRDWGWNARIDTYQVLFPTPKERVLEMVEPTSFKAALREPPIAADPTSNQTAEQIPSYNAYSIDGDVTAPLPKAPQSVDERLDRDARPTGWSVSREPVNAHGSVVEHGGPLVV